MYPCVHLVVLEEAIMSDDFMKGWGRTGTRQDAVDKEAWDAGAASRQSIERSQQQMRESPPPKRVELPEPDHEAMDWAAGNMMLGVVILIRFVFRVIVSFWRWEIAFFLIGAGYVLLSNAVGRTIEEDSLAWWEVAIVYGITGAVFGTMFGATFRLARGIYRTATRLFGSSSAEAAPEPVEQLG
jgi:hypothetical protein